MQHFLYTTAEHANAYNALQFYFKYHCVEAAIWVKTKSLDVRLCIPITLRRYCPEFASFHVFRKLSDAGLNLQEICVHKQADVRELEDDWNVGILDQTNHLTLLASMWELLPDCSSLLVELHFKAKKHKRYFPPHIHTYRHCRSWCTTLLSYKVINCIATATLMLDKLACGQAFSSSNPLSS